MKKFLQVLGALAAAAAAVYVIATYGDRIVAWFQKLCPHTCHTFSDAVIPDISQDVDDAPMEMPTDMDIPVESDTLAEDADFEA